MTASPSALLKTVSVPAKKLRKDDSITFAPTDDGRFVIASVKKGLPKSLQPGMVVASIVAAAAADAKKMKKKNKTKGDDDKDDSAPPSDTEGEDDGAAAPPSMDAQRQAAGKAGGTATIRLQGYVASVKKPSKDAKLGVSLRHDPERDVITLVKVDPEGLFGKTDLAVGQIVTRIGDKPCPNTAAEAVKMLKAMKKGTVTIVAIDGHVGQPEEAHAARDDDLAAPSADEEEERPDAPEASNAEDAPGDVAQEEEEDAAADKQPTADDDEAQDERPDDATEDNQTPAQMEDVDLQSSSDARSAAAASVEHSDDYDREIAAHEEARKGANQIEDKDVAPSTGWLCCAY